MSSPIDEDPCLALLEEHRGILHKVANTYCPRAEDRGDLLQEISIQVWRSYPRFDGRCKVTTWLYRIALNVAISFHRQEHPHRHLDSADEALRELPAPADPGPLREEAAVLHRFLESLDDLSKALVMLYLDGHAHQEIAEILGITPTNAATKLSRIKQRLRQGLQPAPSSKGVPHGTR